MSPKQRRDGPYIWVTWLKGLIVGGDSCEWAGWFKTHWQYYDKAPSDFDSVGWNMNHTRLLRDLRIEREQAGELVTIERQNRFTYRTESGVTIGGIPDLVGVPAEGSQGTIYDAKTGQERDSDKVQVMIYMYLLPMAHPDFEGKVLSGELVYRDARYKIPDSAIDDKFVDNLNFWIEVLASDTSAKKVPSEMECRFCDIGQSECPERMV